MTHRLLLTNRNGTSGENYLTQNLVLKGLQTFSIHKDNCDENNLSHILIKFGVPAYALKIMD